MLTLQEKAKPEDDVAQRRERSAEGAWGRTVQRAPVYRDQVGRRGREHDYALQWVWQVPQNLHTDDASAHGPWGPLVREHEGWRRCG